jgi:hypothetical protein
VARTKIANQPPAIARRMPPHTNIISRCPRSEYHAKGAPQWVGRGLAKMAKGQEDGHSCLPMSRKIRRTGILACQFVSNKAKQECLPS